MASPMSKSKTLAASGDRRIQERKWIPLKSSTSYGTHMHQSQLRVKTAQKPGSRADVLKVPAGKAAGVNTRLELEHTWSHDGEWNERKQLKALGRCHRQQNTPSTNTCPTFTKPPLRATGVRRKKESNENGKLKNLDFTLVAAIGKCPAYATDH